MLSFGLHSAKFKIQRVAATFVAYFFFYARTICKACRKVGEKERGREWGRDERGEPALGMLQSTVAAGNKRNEKPIDLITFPSKQISNCLCQFRAATARSLMFKYETKVAIIINNYLSIICDQNKLNSQVFCAHLEDFHSCKGSVHSTRLD